MYGLVHRWEKSGLLQKEFCKAEGINFYKFKYWRTQLKKESSPKQATSKPKPDRQEFIPIAIENKETTFTGLQIKYPNGVLITCPPNTGKEQLSELIKLY